MNVGFKLDQFDIMGNILCGVKTANTTFKDLVFYDLITRKRIKRDPIKEVQLCKFYVEKIFNDGKFFYCLSGKNLLQISVEEFKIKKTIVLDLKSEFFENMTVFKRKMVVLHDDFFYIF
jgi:hypothetical protein